MYYRHALDPEVANELKGQLEVSTGGPHSRKDYRTAGRSYAGHQESDSDVQQEPAKADRIGAVVTSPKMTRFANKPAILPAENSMNV